MMFSFLHLVRHLVLLAIFSAAGLVHAAITFDNTPSGGSSAATGMELIRDTAAGSPTGQYVGLRFTSNPALTNVYARAVVTGPGYSLNTNEVAVHFIGDLFTTAKTSYWYLTIPQVNVNGAMQVEIWTGVPGATGSVLQGTSINYPLRSLDVDQSASANKIFSVTTNPTSIQLGQNFDVVVCYSVGSSGGSNVLVNPAATSSFNPTNLRLGATKVDQYAATDCSGASLATATNQLYFVGTGNKSTGGIRAIYTFSQVGPTAGNPTPIVSALTGQYKYNSDFTTFSVALPTPSNTTLLSKTVDITESSLGVVVTYTLTATNSGASAVTLDKFVDTLPSTPANATYVAGSTLLNGVAFANNPVIVGQQLTWDNASTTQPFTVPAGGSLALKFKATLPSNPGLYSNNAVAFIGTTQIDTTLALGDNKPAQASTAIGPPNLTVTKLALTPGVINSVNGTSATYTIAVSNSGTTAAGVLIGDQLPSGFTYLSHTPPVLGGGVTRSAILDPTVGSSSPIWGTFTIPGGGAVKIGRAHV